MLVKGEKSFCRNYFRNLHFLPWTLGKFSFFSRNPLTKFAHYKAIFWRKFLFYAILWWNSPFISTIVRLNSFFHSASVWRISDSLFCDPLINIALLPRSFHGFYFILWLIVEIDFFTAPFVENRDNLVKQSGKFLILFCDQMTKFFTRFQKPFDEICNSFSSIVKCKIFIFYVYL